MSDQTSLGRSTIDNSFSETSLHRILKSCANLQSSENLLIEDFNDVSAPNISDYYKMISTSSYSTSGNVSTTSSFASEDSFGDGILEENGRISLAYENLRTIPKRIAEKFAVHTKFLDLSYNNFQNLSFLSFFEGLHTLILDRNSRLDPNTLPYLPNLKILWVNNCNITNLTDWIQRIQLQCPVVEHLSMMGNPGVNPAFKLCNLNSHLPTDPNTPTAIIGDYREYVLHMLPNLEYFDGVPRSYTSLRAAATNPSSHNNNNHIVKNTCTVAATAGTPTGIRLSNRHCSNNINNNSHSDNKLQGHSNSRMKNSPSLSFKELFSLRRRKKSYQSSSTN